MSDFTLTIVNPLDERMMKAVRELLSKEGLRQEKNPNLVCAAIDEEGDVIATGALHGKTLRCMAVSSAHRGEGVLNSVVSFLVQEAFAKGLSHLFLCTKTDTSQFFRDIGFYEIASVPGRIAFLENKSTGFSEYLAGLLEESERSANAAKPDGATDTAIVSADAAVESRKGAPVSAIVLNANPFTKGHLALIEEASRESALLHLFVVTEDASLFPYAIRRRLIEEGCAHLKNIIIHDSGAYLLSSSTFPSYFQKDEDAVTESHASLDASVFLKIANKLNITRRYVGEEESSHTTKIYNAILREVLPKAGVELFEIPRKCENGRPISASFVRSLIHDDRLNCSDNLGAPLSAECLNELKALLPDSTLAFLQSEEAAPVLEAIRKTEDVIHH